MLILFDEVKMKGCFGPNVASKRLVLYTINLNKMLHSTS